MDERIVTALARVFAPRGPQGAEAPGLAVREDTPLAALGPIDQAWPLLAAALEAEGVLLDDAAIADVLTVGDLARACA